MKRATLMLVQDDHGRYLLQGANDPSRNADFSLFDIDGEGGDPFQIAAGRTWAVIESVPGADYDPTDTDSFWEARAEIMTSAATEGLFDS